MYDGKTVACCSPQNIQRQRCYVEEQSLNSGKISKDASYTKEGENKKFEL
jgi:hypothetical protein